MRTLAIIYFAYMFVSIYFLLINLIIYLKNKKEIFYSPPLIKNYSLSVLVPAYNEGESINETIEHIFQTDYPNLIEVIAINDGSKDNTLEVLKKLKEKYSRLKIINKKNSGKASSLNIGLKFAKGDIIAVVDADSFPAKDSFSRIIGYFDDPKVGAATGACIPRNKDTFLEKMQVIEYKVIAFTRKLLEYIDSIYVVPGPLALYRREAIIGIGGFDPKNITEDIEATWHLIDAGWKIKMCLVAKVTTLTPNKIKPWYSQRRRWALGGLQCLAKYKKSFLKPRNMLGYFIFPFFALGLALGLVGIAIFIYLFLKNMISKYLITRYSLNVGIAIITINDFYITPSVLNYFGLVIFVFFLFFNLFVLGAMKDNIGEKQSFFNLLFYMTIYLLVYPIVLLTAIWHLIKRKMVWE